MGIHRKANGLVQSVHGWRCDLRAALCRVEFADAKNTRRKNRRYARAHNQLIKMEYSHSGLHLTEHFEGCRLSAYQDQGGTWTIGFGHTLGVEAGDRCTLTQAYCWLLGDVKNAVHYVTCLVRVSLSQSEFDALVDFTFNVGAENFRHSTLLHKLNAGDYAGAAAEFDRWQYVSGKKCKALFLRREAERREFEETIQRAG